MKLAKKQLTNLIFRAWLLRSAIKKSYLYFSIRDIGYVADIIDYDKASFLYGICPLCVIWWLIEIIARKMLLKDSILRNKSVNTYADGVYWTRTGNKKSYNRYFTLPFVFAMTYNGYVVQYPCILSIMISPVCMI